MKEGKTKQKEESPDRNIFPVSFGCEKSDCTPGHVSITKAHTRKGKHVPIITKWSCTDNKNTYYEGKACGYNKYVMCC